MASPGQSASAPPNNLIAPEVLRQALLKLFEGAPKGSDAAGGLGIVEGKDGNRFLPLPLLGRAVGLSGQDFEIAQAAWASVTAAPAGIFALTDDARAAGLVEWGGWEAFSVALAGIVGAIADPAFEPRSIHSQIIRAARGAVCAGLMRQNAVLQALQEKLLPGDGSSTTSGASPGAAEALQNAVARRGRLALACLTDAIAAQGLRPEAGPDAIGLVGQIPRTLFGPIFDRVDNRDLGTCAFLGEIVQSWDRRRCFSKRWLQDAASRFPAPKNAHIAEREDGRGWYALTAENLHKTPVEEAPPPPEPPKREAATRDSSSPKAQNAENAEKAQKGEKAESGRAAPKDPHRQAKRGGAEVEQEAEELGSSKGTKRSVIAVDADDDDAAIQRRLEESRKRRQALMAKYNDLSKNAPVVLE